MLKRNHIIPIQKNKKSKNIKKIYAKFAEFAKKFLNSADNFVLFFVLYADNIDWRSSSFMKSKAVVLTSSLFSLCVAVFLLTACKDNVYTMLDDYNSHYEPATNMDIVINPGDSGFREEFMLDPTYFVSSEGSINVAAPYNCRSYEWSFYKIIYHQQGGQSYIYSTLVDITAGLDFYSGFGTDKREFRAYVPKSRISAEEPLIPGTYILHLKVIGNNGIEYKDWCSIVIYDQVYGQESFFKED